MGTDPVVTSLLLQTVTTTRVIDDLSDGPHVTTKSFVHVSTKYVKQSAYRFNNIETLGDLPNRERALEILTELANDVGVLAVMEKHKWTVGSLCELYPEGYVGVSETCVMGLNKNKGQSILLRLRTDDLKGFRNFTSIKKVLYHELAHNVHSDHDDQFHLLMRQIEKEVSLLDWRQSKGATTGYESRGSAHNNTIHDRGDSNYHHPQGQSQGGGVEGGVHILGGGGANDALLQQLLPARYLAGSAAILRLSAEEQEVQDNCGSSSSSNATSAQNLISQQQLHPTVVTSVSPPEVAVVVEDVVVEEERMMEEVIDVEAGEEATTSSVAVTTVSDERMDTSVDHTPDSRVLSAIDDNIAYVLSLESAAAPVDKLLQLRVAAEGLVRDKVCEEMVHAALSSGRGGVEVVVRDTVFYKAIKLLLKIVENAKEHLFSTSSDSMKFKSIKTGTNTYQRYLASIPSAVEVLYVAGFSHNTSSQQQHSKQHGEQPQQDPGLLYMAQSVLQGVVEAVDELVGSL
eukprot:gene27073-33743_t